ncbi:MAG: hypothetical protein U5K81_11685 [Trueperaceae bacterium]|nr:hypothetical protein [Trueperaceae bacterium]
MSLRFRNIDAKPVDSVGSWPTEGVIATFAPWSSTYLTGKVAPSTRLLLRMERIAKTLQGRRN